MTSVLHYRKVLEERPASVEVGGVLVRGFALPGDVPAWLTLRGRAVAWLKPAVRAWTAEDFAAEMSGKPWWRNEWTWLATPIDAPQQVIGSVTLAVREGVAGVVPVVHWLLVDPRSRRRGIGRLLMMHLERAAWDEGWREIQLETHAGWTDTVAFYQSIGFESAR
jgi:GNAT superfamily N-acetyltransferase